MALYGFSAPWLKGRPIDAPDKIDLIDWYSQTDGYYPEATEHDSKNSVLRIFRTQGNILYDDEFHSENTINHDDHQTRGRVNRIFRAIDMIKRYKAAYEDGADLSKSLIVDFKTVWYDQDLKIVPRRLMRNLQRVEDEIKNRSPQNSPVKAFWMRQEIERCKWTFAGQNFDILHQDHPIATVDPTNPMQPVCYYEPNFIPPSYFPGSNEHIPTNSFMTVFGCNLQNQLQQLSGWFSQTPQQKLRTTLNPTTAAFIPALKNVNPPIQAQKDATSFKVEPTDPSNESAPPTTPLTIAELIAKGQKEYNWGERDDESWPGDRIFIPTFCRPKQPWSKPQLLGRGYVAPPQSEAENEPEPRDEPDGLAERHTNIHDSGYASGNTPPSENEYAAATNGDSGDDADDEISDSEGQLFENDSDTEIEDAPAVVFYTTSYRMLKYCEYNQNRGDQQSWKDNVISSWLDKIDVP